MTIARSEFQEKTRISFELLMNYLYELYFKRRKQQYFIYSLAFSVSFAYATISHFVFGRSDVSAVYDAVVLALVILLSLPIAYIFGFISRSQAASKEVSQAVPGKDALNTALHDLPLPPAQRAQWLRISNVLEAEPVSQETVALATPARQSWWARLQSKTFTFSLPQLAGAGVAALALIVFSSVSFYRQYNSMLTMRGMQAVAVLPEEAELDRKIETLKARMMTWQPQRRTDFEQQLARIEVSLQNCRRHLQANPDDAVYLAMMHDLYQEKRQLLEDFERLKW